MILCKDCKHCDLERVWCEKHRDYLNSTDEISCTHAERADGLTECCATCRNLLDYDDCNAIECELEQFDYTNRAFINIGNLSCPEWVPREEKE